jgi:hypothetical protein
MPADVTKFRRSIILPINNKILLQTSQFFFVILHPIIPGRNQGPNTDIDNKIIKKQNNAKIKNEIRC